MSKWYQTQKFKDLDYLWLQKLKESGFKDQEKTLGNDRVLTQKGSNAYRQAPQVVRDNKLRYYELIGQCVFSQKWTDDASRIIMFRRSEGVKIKDICLELKDKDLKCHRQTVRFTIRKYENLWGLRKWQPHQLKSK